MPAEVVAKFDYGSLDRLTRTMVESATEEIRQRVTTSALSIIEIGDRLIGVKEQLPHGKFCAWLSAEFDWSDSTANRFMRVAERLKSKSVENLSISPSALYLLASDDMPPLLRDQIIEDVRETGEMVTPRGVRERAGLFADANKADLRGSDESRIKQELIESLKRNGQEPLIEVCVPSGRIDVLTDDAIYEVKDTLDRRKIFEAIGQLLCYRECIPGSRRAVMVGRGSDDLNVLAPFVAAIGIEVRQWN